MRSGHGVGKPPMGRECQSRKGVDVGESDGTGVQEEAGVGHVTGAESLSDGRDVDATAKTRTQGQGRCGAHGGRDQKSWKEVQGVAVVKEAAEAVQRVEGLASGEASIALDTLTEVKDGGALLETNRQMEDGIGANTLEFGDRGGDRRGSGNRGIPRQVHANQLDI